jgi:hypothetical protein
MTKFFFAVAVVATLSALEGCLPMVEAFRAPFPATASRAFSAFSWLLHSQSSKDDTAKANVECPLLEAPVDVSCTATFAMG